MHLKSIDLWQGCQGHKMSISSINGVTKTGYLHAKEWN